MFGIGTTELVVILLILMLVFGAKKLPGLGKGLGEGIRSFKDGLKGDPGPDSQSGKKEIEDKDER